MDHLLFTGEEILERVDEYTLYCSYLEYAPLIGAKYLSPIRIAMGKEADGDPSFGVYEKKYGRGPHEFMWKDQGVGVHGDIFDLVKTLYQLQTRHQAMQQVLVDAGVIPGESLKPIVDLSEKRYMGYSDITITSRKLNRAEINYWDRINVGQALLDEYLTTAVKMYWLYEDQEAPRFPKGMCFAYRMWDKYQLYFPQEVKKKKFRTDFTDACLPGFLQLKYNSELLIITKSYKDVIALRSFGYEAVAPRGESVMVPKDFLEHFKTKYRRILILFDNDLKHKGDDYEFEKIYVPKEISTDKDPTDFCGNHGIDATAEMLRQITCT